MRLVALAFVSLVLLLTGCGKRVPNAPTYPDPDAGLTREQRWEKHAPLEYADWKDAKQRARKAREDSERDLGILTENPRPDANFRRNWASALESRVRHLEEVMDEKAKITRRGD